MPENAAPSSAPRFARSRFRRITLIASGIVIGLAAWQFAPLVMKWQARRAIAARDLDGAATLLKRVDSWYGSDAELEFLWARLNRKQGNWIEVRNRLLRARDLKYPVDLLEREQWLTLAQIGQLRQAEPHLQRLLTDPRDDGAEICEAYVNGYFLNHRMSDVGRLLDAWIADFPRDSEPLLIRGKIRAEQQFLKDAETDLRAAMTLDPASTSIRLELADVLVLERQVEPALEIYRKVAAGHSPPTRARLGEVKCLRLLNRFEEAQVSAQRILDREPSDREALVELGLANLELSHYEQATASLQKALSVNPRSIVVRQGLARACRATGDLPQAREHAEYVAKAQSALAMADQMASRITEQPNDANLRYEIGQIYLRYAVPERGIQWLKSALECDPNHQGAAKALAEHFAGAANSISSEQNAPANEQKPGPTEQKESP